MKFRLLNADEIECRVSTVSEKGLSLLLYKDARADMNLLDETVGPMNWQRSHTRDNANCIVSIWDDVKNQWVSKEDTGTESFTEKEKGLASDSFKRACFNWGIGRELYTAPKLIWIMASDIKFTEKNGKKTTYDKFIVKSIGYTDKGIINALEIENMRSRKTVYQMKATDQPVPEKLIDKAKQDQLLNLILETNSDPAAMLTKFKVSDVAELTETQFKIAMKNYLKKKEVSHE
jgi:hypothetical protein